MAIMDDVARQRAEYFKQKRAEAQGQVGAQTQEAQDVIQRRFASLGAQGSGAQVAAEQKMREQAGAQARQAQTDITGQELAANEGDIGRRFQAEQAQLGREYGTAERLGTQQFQAGQQAAQNLFASSEAALGRGFTASEAESQRKFLAGESQASRELQSRMAADDLALKKSMADMQNAKTKEELALAREQFNIDKETTDFNKYLSLITAGFDRITAQTMAFGNKVPGQAPQSSQSQSPTVPGVVTNVLGVPMLPPLPPNATQQERFDHARKQEEILAQWSKGFGQIIDIGIH